MRVKKRVVFYLSGFDPRGVRHYHQMYKEHAHKQSFINGMSYDVSSRRKINNHQYEWDIFVNENKHHIHTTYRFLGWDDIIRAEWSSELVSYYKDLICFMMGYIFNGLFFLFAKASPKQLIAGFYPILYLVGTLAIAVYFGMKLNQLLGGWIGFMVAVISGIGIVYSFERLGNKIGVFWLLRIYAFSVRWGNGQVDLLEERIDYFSNEIANCIENSDDIDEILLISHSVGTILAVSVLSRAIQHIDSVNWGKFSMVTLGECIPLVSFQPNAVNYRQELINITKSNLLWLDYTSPIDGACFPLHNFLKSSGIACDNYPNIYFRSPRFHKLFDKITYQKLRRDWYKTHFLYLMSTQYDGEYDFFTMTAGSNSIRNKTTRTESR
jgi:hypothetical protein